MNNSFNFRLGLVVAGMADLPCRCHMDDGSSALGFRLKKCEYSVNVGYQKPYTVSKVSSIGDYYAHSD
jgi:hypothetical protein